MGSAIPVVTSIEKCRVNTKMYCGILSCSLRLRVQMTSPCPAEGREYDNILFSLSTGIYLLICAHQQRAKKGRGMWYNAYAMPK